MTSNCIYCSSNKIKSLKKRTLLGYHRFYCRVCHKRFNERSNTPFNLLQFPTDIVLMVVRWRLMYKLSLRDLSDMFLERGIQFSHETIRDWEKKFTPLIINSLRKRRRGKSGVSWYIDETYIKVSGKWCYLYRAIDTNGNLVDCRLSDKRDFGAATEFFKSALQMSETPPERATTDGHPSYPRSISEVLGKNVKHRTNQYLNNMIEQDHRGIKQRYGPMRGFNSFKSAERFCRAFDELINFYKVTGDRKTKRTNTERRQNYLRKTAIFNEMLMTVS